MWVLEGNRRALLEQIQKLGTPLQPKESDELPPRAPNTGECRLVWWRRPGRGLLLPEAIIVPTEEHIEFLAWAITYLDGFRPFTAYCRVIAHDDALRLVAASGRDRSDFLEPAYVGGALGEAMEMRVEARSSEISPRACMNTCLFAAARAGTIGTARPDEAAARWLHARKVGHASVATARLSVFVEVAEILDLVHDPSREQRPSEGITLACQQIRNFGAVKEELLRDLATHEGLRLPKASDGTREEKFASFESAFGSVDGRKQPSSVVSFLLGYMLSRVAPGSMEHGEILRQRYASNYPGVVAWYGVCAGLVPESRLEAEFNGLGRRLARELSHGEDLLQRPHCDIALDEFELWMKAPNAALVLRGVGIDPGRLRVELVPGVLNVVPLPQTALGGQRPLFEDPQHRPPTSQMEPDNDLNLGRIAAQLRHLANAVERAERSDEPVRGRRKRTKPT
jgi:hypothetical protein